VVGFLCRQRQVRLYRELYGVELEKNKAQELLPERKEQLAESN
jgi:hypothetical protein